MNVPLEVCSAGALLRFYRRLIGHARYDVGFPSCGLGDLFVAGARALIEQAGGTVMLSTDVVALTGNVTRVTGAELADGRTIRAKRCIAALPPQGLRRVSRREWIDTYDSFRELGRFHPSPYVSTYLWLDRKLTDNQFWARAFNTSDLNCDFYDYSNIYPGARDRPSLIGTNCIYCDRMGELSDEEIVQQTVFELAEYLPEARSAKVVHSVVNRIPMAIHCPYPGTEQRRPNVRSPVENLLLAGDWVSTGLPSSMESACMAGWQAAEAVYRDIGHEKQLAEPHKEIEGLARIACEIGRRLPLPRTPRWVRPAGRPIGLAAP